MTNLLWHSELLPVILKVNLIMYHDTLGVKLNLYSKVWQFLLAYGDSLDTIS